MLGLIAKVMAICLLVVAGITIALNYTGTYTWGMVSIHTPDARPCEHLGTTFKTPPVLTEVRWSWVQDQGGVSGDTSSHGISYGWSCYFEFPDDSKTTVPYQRAPAVLSAR